KSCYWCGALCWGEYGHHDNIDYSKKHHTSHQPGGLNRTNDRDTHELLASPCHKFPDNCDVYYFGRNEPTKWGIAKVQDFSDWRFEAHYNYMFNDLMCWF